MKDLLRLIGFMIQFLIVTIVLLACFAGLYGLVHFADPVYRDNKTLLKEHAVEWALTMIGSSFLAIVGFIIITLIFSDQVLHFIDLHLEGLVISLLSIAGLLIIGLISGFFTLQED